MLEWCETDWLACMSISILALCLSYLVVINMARWSTVLFYCEAYVIARSSTHVAAF